MAGPASFFLHPNFFPLPRSSLLTAPGEECSEQTTQRGLAVGGWPLRSISCLWLTTASCSELQHLTPIKFFPPRGGRCHEGLTSFVGVETQAFQQLKTGSQVSRYVASPGPSEAWNQANSETPLGQILEGRGVQLLLSPSGQGLHFPFGPFALWVAFFIWGALFNSRGWFNSRGFLKEQEGYVQMPQETKLSDSLPRTTWGLHLISVSSLVLR